MNYKRTVLMVFLLVIFLGGCTITSDYNKYVNQYNSLYKEIINKIDPEKPNVSLQNNELDDSITQLESIIALIDKESPNKRSTKDTLLHQRHESIKEIVFRLKNWEKLNELEKLEVKLKVSALRETGDKLGK